ncbi:hypothetical protein WMF31_25205 [Sorangium sp. So ce1036]|uniref:hypothetical protein n=1 Tax=Sorangium sp. So ce1036 TaxID=3133328 RepID=UPI003F01EF69
MNLHDDEDPLLNELHLDPAASRLVVRTRAIGMLARLAHDLEITAARLRGRARLDGASWTAELEVDVAGLRVAGILRGDRLDPDALSAGDRREIERRMREEVLRGTEVVAVRASGATRDRAEVRVQVASGSAALTARVSSHDRGDGAVGVVGGCQLSLSALGVPEIKGPLGAFRVRDELEILVDLTLRPAG